MPGGSNLGEFALFAGTRLGLGLCLGGLAGIVGAQFALEGVEPARPEGAGLVQPGVELVEPGGIEGLDARLALGAGRDETGPAQDIQVLGNRGGAEVEGLDQFAGGAVARREELNNAPAGRIGDGGKALHAGDI